jgi:transcriptional regulator with XRE-family HTH domain
MAITQEQRQRLDQVMNTRRLDLGITWRDVASRAGLSYEALRRLRTGDGGIRDLTAAKISRALEWTPGSVDAVLGGGEPAPAAAREAAEGDATVTILRGALSAGEQYILDSDLDPEFAAELVRAWREHGIDELIRLYADRQRRVRNG